jgi:hypothetical protein
LKSAVAAVANLNRSTLARRTAGVDIHVGPSAVSDVAREVGKAVLIAGLSAAVAELAKWGVEELRRVVRAPPRAEEEQPKGGA